MRRKTAWRAIDLGVHLEADDDFPVARRALISFALDSAILVPFSNVLQQASARQ